MALERWLFMFAYFNYEFCSRFFFNSGTAECNFSHANSVFSIEKVKFLSRFWSVHFKIMSEIQLSLHIFCVYFVLKIYVCYKRNPILILSDLISVFPIFRKTLIRLRNIFFNLWRVQWKYIILKRILVGTSTIEKNWIVLKQYMYSCETYASKHVIYWFPLSKRSFKE